MLAGGIGSRFWPASTPARPKPLLALASDRPLIRDTVERARRLAPDDRVAILTGAHLAAPILEALPSFDPEQVWIEPEARGTGPVLAWAAHRMHRVDPEAVLVSLHADHRIDPESAFSRLIPRAVALARQEDLLLTIAVPPDRPETGYGYIRTGNTLVSDEGLEAWRVDAFIEKPERTVAESYLRRGYLWNSGIFVLPVSRFLEEIRTHAPELGRHLALLDRREDEAFFEAAPRTSVDEAVMERSGRVGAVRATFEWDDVGSWEALARSRTPDEAGNRLEGQVYAHQARNSIAWAEDGPVVLFDVENLVVVRSNGVTLVTSRRRAPDLKDLLGGLPAWLREGRPDPSEAS
ncbi:MAG: sugar phosphate nucleotidyltransferase [Gemmatimonadota bacterium]